MNEPNDNKNLASTIIAFLGAILLVFGMGSAAVLSMQGKVKQSAETLPIAGGGLVSIVIAIVIRAKYDH